MDLVRIFVQQIEALELNNSVDNDLLDEKSPRKEILPGHMIRSRAIWFEEGENLQNNYVI